MQHTYEVKGMTCKGCQQTVQQLLSKIPGVKEVSVDLPRGQAVIGMETHIPTDRLKAALKEHPEFHLSDAGHLPAIDPGNDTEENKAWFVTYKLVLLIFAYITGISLLNEMATGNFDAMRWMNLFMGSFFIMFSFFKLLNLRGFAESYATYDIVAMKWQGWGYVYAFFELALGTGFLFGIYPVIVNGVTFVLMSVSIIGVLNSVLIKRKIKCACLGGVFNLPMSTITIIEDALMIGMSGVMLLMIL